MILLGPQGWNMGLRCTELETHACGARCRGRPCRRRLPRNRTGLTSLRARKRGGGAGFQTIHILAVYGLTRHAQRFPVVSGSPRLAWKAKKGMRQHHGWESSLPQRKVKAIDYANAKIARGWGSGPRPIEKGKEWCLTRSERRDKHLRASTDDAIKILGLRVWPRLFRKSRSGPPRPELQRRLV